MPDLFRSLRCHIEGSSNLVFTYCNKVASQAHVAMEIGKKLNLKARGNTGEVEGLLITLLTRALAGGKGKASRFFDLPWSSFDFPTVSLFVI